MSFLYKNRHTIIYSLVIILIGYLIYRLQRVESKYEKLKKRKHRSSRENSRERQESSSEDEQDEASDVGSDEEEVEAEIEPVDAEDEAHAETRTGSPPPLEKVDSEPDEFVVVEDETHSAEAQATEGV